MGHIFISYSHKDTVYAHKLARALQDLSLEVWIDERLDYGSQWPLEIQKQLDSCNAFIVIMSPRSFESEWVQSELQRAKRKLKPVFPMLLEGDEPWLSVESTQYYDVRKGNLPDGKFFSAIQRVTASAPGDVAASVDEARQPFAPKKPKLTTIFVLAAIGVVAIAGAIFLPPLFSNGEPPDIPPTSSAQEPAPILASQTSEPVVVSPETIEPDVQSVSDSGTDDVYDDSGLPMRFIPAGEFEMGSSDSAYSEEQPAHTVYLDDFFIDKYEVPNWSYRDCVNEGVCSWPNNTSSVTHSDYFENPEYDGYPVIYIDWEMAVTYCEEWRGARLPTEAQWEKAARGTDGRSYPWGEDIDSSLTNYNGDVGDTTAIGSYEDGQSMYGVYDMAGNVWEWVADWYDESYYESLGEYTENPTGPSNGEFHVLRGGSWVNEGDFVRAFTRGWNDLSYFEFTDFSFRCARDTVP